MSDLFTEQLALFTEVSVQWWLGVISFIGTTATGIGVTEALHFLWK